jgi:hypothetical protein
MGTVVRHIYTHPMNASKLSTWRKFINWCDSQQKYRLGWMIVTITLHGCVLSIFTMFAVILAGNHFIFWPFVIGAIGMTLFTNLVELPTKITIPVFFFSVLVDIVIVISCIAIGFHFRGTMI